MGPGVVDLSIHLRLPDVGIVHRYSLVPRQVAISLFHYDIRFHVLGRGGQRFT